jgi:uncharacterized membrane protein HdeD (DUF308 family)
MSNVSNFSNEARDYVKGQVKYWWVGIFMGIVYLVAAFFIFKTPVVAFLGLSIVFAASFIVNGLMEVIFSISNWKSLVDRSWHLVIGMLEFILGVLLISNLATSVATLIFYVAFALMFRSIFGIAAGINMRENKIDSWGWMVFFSVLGLGASVYMLVNPAFTAAFTTTIAALMFLIVGISSIIFSLNMRKINNRLSGK